MATKKEEKKVKADKKKGVKAVRTTNKATKKPIEELVVDACAPIDEQKNEAVAQEVVETVSVEEPKAKETVVDESPEKMFYDSKNIQKLETMTTTKPVMELVKVSKDKTEKVEKNKKQNRTFLFKHGMDYIWNGLEFD